MLNEAQAYLVHTNDKRYFLPDRAGLTEEEATPRGMPDGWLKTAATSQQLATSE